MAQKQYRVLNPRDLPVTTHIICNDNCQEEGQKWYADAVMTKPHGWTTETMRELVAIGYLEEVT